MKIASKINRATYTRLNKRNLKDLMIDINDQCGDLTLEANYLAGDWKPLGSGIPGVDKLSEEYKGTMAYWHKEVKAGFRVFKSNAVKIQKAYDKWLVAAAKEKIKKQK